MMRGFFAELPRDLEEAALVDGDSRLGALVRIVLPLVAPGAELPERPVGIGNPKSQS